ncbi:MAG: PspA/IM30 family protein [Gemmatimonadota bacterium]|nr:PspA/IM30 family protein [Gemmatimonadota bacterium]
MSIFSKFSTMIKSNINDLISRAENPEKMLNQIILDMRDQLAKAKREVAAAIADERKLKGQLQGEVKQARDWEHRAMLAVKEGRDDLAKQALMRQQEHADRAAVLEGTWQAQAQETEKLKGSLRQLNDKIEEAKRKRNLLIAKQKRAQAQKRIHETMSGLSDTSAFEAFNRMAEKIEEEERRSLAHAEVTEALAGDTLETEFLRLESGSGDADVDNRLAALKAEMGLLPSGAGDAPKQIGSGRAADEAADSAASDGSEVDAAEGEAADEPPIREAELLEEFDKLQRGGARA